MRTPKRRQRHSLPFGLFLAVLGALLLPVAVAPRANAGSTDYWDSEYPLGLSLGPDPELLSQPQGVLINQPLAYNDNANLALDAAPDGEPGGSQPFQVDALFSWTGATNTTWSTSTNWSPAGPPGAGDTAIFNRAFTNQPIITGGDAGMSALCHMTTGCRSKRRYHREQRDLFHHWPKGYSPVPASWSITHNAFTLTIAANLGVDHQ